MGSHANIEVPHIIHIDWHDKKSEKIFSSEIAKYIFLIKHEKKYVETARIFELVCLAKVPPVL